MAKLVALLAVLALSTQAVFGEKLTFNGSQVFRVIPTTQEQLDALISLRQTFTITFGLDWWKYPSALGKEVDVRVPPQMVTPMANMFKQINISTRVMIQDVQTLIDLQMKGAAITSNANDFDFSQYHKLDEINAWVLSLPQAYPNLVSVFQVATSYEKRPMYAVKVSANNSTKKQAFWIDGGIHAREWITPATVIYMLNQFLVEYGHDASTTRLLDTIDLFVLPVFNPDGYEYTWTTDRMWRKTRSHNGHVCIGVDPNRNWDFHWDDGGSSLNPCDDAYCGPKAFSEVEVSTVAQFIKNNSYINGYINFHSYGQLWMSPWGYTGSDPKDFDTQDALSKAATDALTAVHGIKYTYGTIYNVIYPASGSSVDWTYGVVDVVYSYGVELRDTGEYGFLLPADQIIPSGEETLAALKVAMQYVAAHPRQ